MHTKKAKIRRLLRVDLYEATIDLGFGIYIERRVRLKGFPKEFLKNDTVKEYVQSKISYQDVLLVEENELDDYGNPLVLIFYGYNKRNLAQDIYSSKALKKGM